MRIARAAATVGFAAIVIALFPVAAATASAATITGAQSAQVTPADTPWGPPQNTPPGTASSSVIAPMDTPWG